MEFPPFPLDRDGKHINTSIALKLSQYFINLKNFSINFFFNNLFVGARVAFAKMTLTLYMIEFSPLVRSVRIAADILNIKLELRKVNILKREQYLPEYIKLNPTHSVPTLVDGDIVICDSHAINPYLVRKYGKNNALYPNDFAKRALIDEKLYFDACYLYPDLRTFMRDRFLNKIDANTFERVKCVIESYGILEKFLEKNKWMAGACITLADISILPTVDSLDVLIPIDGRRFPKLKVWMKQAQAAPEFRMDEDGLLAFKTFAKQLFPDGFDTIIESAGSK